MDTSQWHIAEIVKTPLDLKTGSGSNLQMLEDVSTIDACPSTDNPIHPHSQASNQVFPQSQASNQVFQGVVMNTLLHCRAGKAATTRSCVALQQRFCKVRQPLHDHMASVL
jgi:hypothetical protein